VVLSTIREGDYFWGAGSRRGPALRVDHALEPCRCFVIPWATSRDARAQPAFRGAPDPHADRRVRSLVRKGRRPALKDVYGRFAKFVDENAIERNGARVCPNA